MILHTHTYIHRYGVLHTLSRTVYTYYSVNDVFKGTYRSGQRLESTADETDKNLNTSSARVIRIHNILCYCIEKHVQNTCCTMSGVGTHRV